MLALCLFVFAQLGAVAWLRRRKRLDLPLLGRMTLGLLAVAAALAASFALTDASIEDSAPLLWTVTALGAAVVGASGSARARRVVGTELVLATLLPFDLALGWALLRPESEGLAGPHARALLIAPAVLILAGYFGASIGRLFFSGQADDRRLGYEAMVGRRFLLGKASPVLSTVTTISVVGVALGVWLVSLSLGILGGFEDDLQRKIIGANAHVLVQRDGGRPFAPPPDLLAQIERTPGALIAAPFVEGEVAVASTSNYGGAMLFGIDPSRGPRALGIFQELEGGSLERLADPGGFKTVDGELVGKPPPVVIGRELAKILNVTLGDRLRIVSPVLEVMTPLGTAPKTMSLEVIAIFSSKMYEFDARFAYTNVEVGRRFFELEPGDVHGVHVQATDADRAAPLARELNARLGLDAIDWQRRNQTLFSALKLERVVAFVVLIFIILVASFSIVNTLVMSIIEKRKAIAILKTVGARDVGIMKIFLVQGMLVGGFGTAVGALVAAGFAFLLERFGFWIPDDVYYIDSLPVDLRPTDLLLVTLAALLIVWDFAVAPALQGARLEPVEGLRDG